MPTATPQTTTEQIPKRIIFETNYRGKMALDYFIHIAPAPKHRIPESVAARTTIKVETRDGSHEPIQVRLQDLARFEFCQLPYLCDQICQDSHGMATKQLVQWFIEKYPGIHHQTQLGIYYYSKIKTTTNGI